MKTDGQLVAPAVAARMGTFLGAHRKARTAVYTLSHLENDRDVTLARYRERVFISVSRLVISHGVL